jgi:hypothetical protein
VRTLAKKNIVPPIPPKRPIYMVFSVLQLFVAYLPMCHSLTLFMTHLAQYTQIT